jgi:transposase-like protein
VAASSPDPSDRQQGQVQQAYLLLERLRWGGHPRTCPHCSVGDRCYLLRASGGETRRTRTGAGTARRIWKCGACRRQFSVLTGTVLQGTRVPLPAWVSAVELLATGEAVSAATVSAATGIGREAARHVIARWAAATGHEPLRSVLAGNGQLFQG